MYNIIEYYLTYQFFSVNTDGVIGFLVTPCIFRRNLSVRDFSFSPINMSSVTAVRYYFSIQFSINILVQIYILPLSFRVSLTFFVSIQI